MPTIVSSDPCTICSEHESVMHSHHTIPRSRGGDNSRQIILCSGCHNILHANALYLVSCINNPKRKKRTLGFWSSLSEERRAEPWLQILVQALLLPVENPEEVGHPVGAVLTDAEFQMFKVLAKDLGCSQTNAVRYCINNMIEKKGLKHGQAAAPMWFLPLSGQRKNLR
jgi:hypothetical protein